jgi:hypothetical protein
VIEFKIEGDALRREARFRVLSWSAVLLLMAATVLLFVLGVNGVLGASSSLRFLFVFTLLGTVASACILACREALSYAERQMIFVLCDNGIVRKRQGYPEVKIAFSEINTLREELNWLIINSTEPRRKIAVPTNVKGYEVIRAELAKHHALSARAAFPLKSSALLVVSVLSWAAVLWSRDARIVISAGTVALITLAFGSRRLWTLLHRRSKLPLLWTSLGFAWLVALLLIYLRIVRL